MHTPKAAALFEGLLGACLPAGTCKRNRIYPQTSTRTAPPTVWLCGPGLCGQHDPSISTMSRRVIHAAALHHPAALALKGPTPVDLTGRAPAR